MLNEYTKNAQIPFRFMPCLTALHGLSYYVAMKYAPDRVQLF